ncbi:hypothetical protein GCK32_018745, partial [Trichostrongylus colubriformis]
MATVTNNYDSTDPWNGYPCRADSNAQTYLNKFDTQKAMHTDFQLFLTCSKNQYGQMTTDLTVDLSNVINHNVYKSRNMSVVLYNGDLDTVHNFLGAQNFMRTFATVQGLKGAGHFVPKSRPAQALQVFRNFVNGFSYDNCLQMVPLAAAPLLDMYSYMNPPVSRKDADR